MKIYAIVTKNGTLDEIKEFVNPYKNHTLSKKLVKTKEEWIKKSKFKNFYKIEKCFVSKNQFGFRKFFIFFKKKIVNSNPKINLLRQQSKQLLCKQSNSLLC